MTAETDDAPSPALSVMRHSGCSVWGGLVLGLVFSGIFLAVGCGLLYYMVISPWFSIRAATSWDETPCLIQSSEVKVHRGDENDSYSIEVRFTYEVNDQHLTGDRYSFFTMNSNSRKWREDVVRGIPPGTQTVCYVNPNDIRQAVLHRGWTPDWIWGFFPLPFALIGIVGVSWTLYAVLLGKTPLGVAPVVGPDGKPTYSANLSNQGAGRSVSSGGIAAWSASEFDDDDLNEPAGPVSLKSEGSPFVAFIALLLFALFWNGMVAIFVGPRVGPVLQGNWNWSDLFMVMFVLAGVGLVLAAIHRLLASFNPVPVLTLSRQWIPLGSSAVLTWGFVGSTRSIRTLKVTLEGQEEATYRRGTDTVTDREVFFSEVLFESTDPFEISTGADTEIDIPSDSMHTFTGDHNKVVWRLNFVGEIPYWPDIHATFPIRVMPHE